LALESIDHVEGGDCLALGVLGVCDGVTDDTLEEGLQDTAGLLVDHGRDTLDTTTTSETSDSGLGDTLDVVTKNLAVALGAALAETLAALAACSDESQLLFPCGCVFMVRAEQTPVTMQSTKTKTRPRVACPWTALSMPRAGWDVMEYGQVSLTSSHDD
jgi:hypothetical protein